MKKDVLRKIAIIIPSLNPDEKLQKYIEELIKIGFKNIIIVNDGSRAEFDVVFERLENFTECEVLKHAVNQGKGRALKTGFHYYLNQYTSRNNEDGFLGVVTADADGQHSPQDTYKVAEELYLNNDSLILGTRNFNDDSVPFKSKYGNKITTVIFKLLNGKLINDTQTGLRGISNPCVSSFLNLDGEKFDYEINVLIFSTKNRIDIREIEIETIYIDDNRETHFNSIKDSFKIYKLIFRSFITFVISGSLSAIVDLFTFYILITYCFTMWIPTFNIFMATFLARIISSVLNYNLNRKVVFKSDSKHSFTLLKYYTLCGFQLLASWGLVSLLFYLSNGIATIIKLIVDIFLFFISFKIQKNIIFKGEGK